MASETYYYEIFDAGGNLIYKSRNFKGYLVARRDLFSEMCVCENESTAFIYCVLGNGKNGRERRFILKNHTVVEYGLLGPRDK